MARLKRYRSPVGFCALMVSLAAGGGELDPLGLARGRRGLGVHVGCGTGTRTVLLARASCLILHALDPDGTAVEAARSTIREAGLEERVVVEQWFKNQLPYPDNYVNLLVVEEKLSFPNAELARVLAPGGLGVVRSGATWRRITKERPAGMGEWTHQRHGPDGNPVSEDTIPMRDVPDRLRWVNSVLQVWSHSIRTAGGRVLLFINDVVSAHDAYNGVLLWKGQYAGVKTNSRPSAAYNRPVVTADRIYLYAEKGILVVDAATGEALTTFTAAGRPLDFVVAKDPASSGKVLVCRDPAAVSCLEARSGKLRWRVEAPMNPGDVAKDRKGRAKAYSLQHVFVGGDRVYFVTGRTRQTGQKVDRKGNRTPIFSFQSHLVGLAIHTGREVWRNEDERLGDPAYLALYAGGVLCGYTPTGYFGVPTDAPGDLWVLPVARWDKRRTKLGRTPFKDPKRALVSCLYTDGLIWVRDDSGVVYGKKQITEPEQKTRGWLGIDPRTGEPKRTVGYPVDMKWSGRCYDDIATRDCLLAQTMEIVSLGTDADLKHIRGVRGQCGIGFVIGNRTVYTPPNQCIGCYPMVRGLGAYEVPAEVRVAVKEEERLEKGPAYGESVGKPLERDDEWAMFRHNCGRTGATPMRLEARGLRERWQTSVGSRATQPIVTGGKVVCGLIDVGSVVCVDASDGRRLWDYTAGGRIDTSPSVYGNLCLFGAHDGYIYCLRMSDGALVWRFNAAPEHRRIVSGDRIESPWPVLGSVLVYQGVVHAIAGHYSAIDGGLHRWGLDPATARVRYHHCFTGIKGEGARILPTHWYKHEDHALNNLLVGRKQRVRLYEEWGGWEFNPQDGSLIRQSVAVPQPGWPKGRVSPGDPKEADRWPWCGYDRVSGAFLLRCEPLSFATTLEMDPRTRFSGKRGQFMFFPETGTTGIFLRVRDFTTRVDPEPWVVPTDTKAIGFPEVFARDPALVSAKAKLWSTVHLPLRAHAVVMTGQETLWVAGSVAAKGQSEIRALSMRTGKERTACSFSGHVTFEGMAAACGRLFVATRDGRLLCFEP